MSGVAAIVLAAGSGVRFGERKQWLEIADGVRLVDRAVKSSLKAAEWTVLVLPEGVVWDGEIVDSVAIGGPSRLDSVAAGLRHVPTDYEIVVIHDAAHPLAGQKIFDSIIQAVVDGADAAVPFLPTNDVIKSLHADGSIRTVGRDGLGLAQVPMAFRKRALLDAHRDGTGSAHVWEDSQLVEAIGGRVVAVEGSVLNVHVVDSGDLEVARSIERTHLEAY